MDNPGLHAPLWAMLDGKLWHATGSTQLAAIIADGEIRVIGDRYKNSLCKLRGGVSLMDFGPTAVNLSNQFHNWSGWLGHQQDCRVAVWFEIDRDAVVANLDDARAAHSLSRLCPSRSIIPGVEACHRGAIPIAAIASVLLIDRDFGHTSFRVCAMNKDMIDGHLTEFEQSLPPTPPEHPVVKALKAGRDRARVRE